MHARLVATILSIIALFCPMDACAQEDLCAKRLESFNGYWGGGQIQVNKRIAGIPLSITSRFSYREIRFRPCSNGIRSLPPGVGEASVSVGVPILNNRRGGWLLRMAAQGQGSQRPGELVSGMITGAPATTGHINIWETPIPLIQFTGAASAVIQPQARDFPMSIAYLGGVRIYPLYGKHTQANLGLTAGGSNRDVNFIPAIAFRVSNLNFLKHRIALGVELRSPVSLVPGPIPHQWRLWGALTLTVDELDDEKTDPSHAKATSNRAFDVVHSVPENAPPAQTTWETTL